MPSNCVFFSILLSIQKACGETSVRDSREVEDEIHQGLQIEIVRGELSRRRDHLGAVFARDETVPSEEA